MKSSEIVGTKTTNLRYFYIQMLTEKCSSVKTISILNSPLISDTGMKYLTAFRRLQKIQIEGSVHVSRFNNVFILIDFKSDVMVGELIT